LVHHSSAAPGTVSNAGRAARAVRREGNLLRSLTCPLFTSRRYFFGTAKRGRSKSRFEESALTAGEPDLKKKKERERNKNKSGAGGAVGAACGARARTEGGWAAGNGPARTAAAQSAPRCESALPPSLLPPRQAEPRATQSRGRRRAGLVGRNCSTAARRVRPSRRM